jgi:hypothetical protein
VPEAEPDWRLDVAIPELWKSLLLCFTGSFHYSILIDKIFDIISARELLQKSISFFFLCLFLADHAPYALAACGCGYHGCISNDSITVSSGVETVIYMTYIHNPMIRDMIACIYMCTYVISNASCLNIQQL